MRSLSICCASCFSALRQAAVVEVFGLALIALLFLWAQPAIACPEADAAVHLREAPRENSVVTVSEDFEAIAAERCCECSLQFESLRSAAPDGKQFLLLPDAGVSIGVSASSCADLAGVLTARADASNSAAGAARRPPYLLTSRLRR